MKETTFENTDLSYFYSFILKKNHGFIEKKSPSVEEELDYIDIDDVGNLEDSPILVFIDEECRNVSK